MSEKQYNSQSSKWTFHILLPNLPTLSVVFAFSFMWLSSLQALDSGVPALAFGMAEEVICHPAIFEHVPLMPGLKVIDKLDGAPHEVAVYKVVAEAAGTVVADDIFDYYEYNLPKHGWDIVPGHRGHFVNSAEELTIIPHNRQDILTMTFKLHR